MKLISMVASRSEGHPATQKGASLTLFASDIFRIQTRDVIFAVIKKFRFAVAPFRTTLAKD